ncbi:MAG: hypothetical protein ACNS61_07820 [Candidatus Wenzhouxiangella sp. M2_3B_020]
MNPTAIDSMAGPLRGFSCLASTLLLVSTSVLAADAPITLRGAVHYDTGTLPARVRVDMSRLPVHPGWRPGDPIKEIPQRKGVPRDFVPPEPAEQRGGDPLREMNRRFPERSGGRAFDAPLIDQGGLGFSGVNPPDPVGDVGNDYYVQMINGSGGARVRILNKTDGSRAVDDQGESISDFNLDALAVGSGTGCTMGEGDPIVMFDHSAPNDSGPPGRWFLSEFTSVSMCVYISETSDPTAGNWTVYEIFSESGARPDYPKYGIWTDAYYVGTNEFSAGSPQPSLYAFDRENMLQGVATRPSQAFVVPSLDGFGFQMLHPADWDGATEPPADAPGLFLRHRDDEVHDAGANDTARDFLEIWRFDVDWDDAGNSTLTGPETIDVVEFESELCGLTSFSCVPQPAEGVALDPLREPMMWRVQYRNFGTHEALVGSWVTDVVGGTADVHGVRWAELRNAGSGWTAHQQGTVSPDDVHRWMPTVAMDGAGNIAVGYNVSDAVDTYPGLRYTGRLASDPLDVMPIGEVRLAEGSAANPSNRYGDYSSLNVDPVDDCTYWFTGEYNPAAQWSTRIAKFRFSACGDPTFILRGAPDRLEACTAGSDQQLPDVTLSVGSFDSFSGTVDLAFSGPLPPPLSGTIVPDQVTASEPPAESILSLTAESGLASGVHDVGVTATSAGTDSQSVQVLVDVADALPDASPLQSPTDGATAVDRMPVFEWSSSDQAREYVFELAADSAFTDIVATAIVTDTTFQPEQELASLTEYHWRVTPLNQCGAGPVASGTFTTELAPGTCEPGALETTYFLDDLESGEGDWTHAAGAAAEIDTWTLQSAEAASGSFAWRATSSFGLNEVGDRVSDQRLVSPSVSLPPDAASPTLEFLTDFALEASDGGCWDAGLVEYSTDDGTTWSQFAPGAVLDTPYTGVVASGSSSPIEGFDGWCGTQAWTQAVIDLRGLEGQDLRFRFRLGTDELITVDDWLIDDVAVQSCEPDFLFADGFE